MATTWALASMTMSDYDQVMLLLASCDGVGQTASDERSDIERFLQRNPGLSQVATDQGHVVGTALCGHDARRGMIYHLAVHPNHRRQGIATAMIDACLVGLTRLGVRKCNIVVYENNASGAAFWHNHGWTLRADLVFMQKSLA